MKQIPVLLVTGFLGAGKTTFLNWLIQNHPNLKISLILNEFGDIKLESQFVKNHSGGEIAELANGCMCCLAKSDIPRVINLILEKSPQTQYIIIEASGLSDPDPIHDALSSAELRDRIRLESVLCIADAVNFEKSLAEHPIVMSQVGDANSVILSKVKEAGEETTNRVKQFIESIGIGTKVLLWNDNLSPDLFMNFDVQSELVGSSRHKKHDHREHDQYDELWFNSEYNIDLSTFTILMNTLPSRIIRAKGYINSEGTKVMIQYVANKLETFVSEWNDENPHSAVLFLGRKIDRDALTQALKLCEQ